MSDGDSDEFTPDDIWNAVGTNAFWDDLGDPAAWDPEVLFNGHSCKKAKKCVVGGDQNIYTFLGRNPDGSVFRSPYCRKCRKRYKIK